MFECVESECTNDDDQRVDQVIESKDFCITSPLKGQVDLREDRQGVCVLEVSPYEDVKSDLLTEQTIDATLAQMSHCLL